MSLEGEQLGALYESQSTTPVLVYGGVAMGEASGSMVGEDIGVAPAITPTSNGDVPPFDRLGWPNVVKPNAPLNAFMFMLSLPQPHEVGGAGTIADRLVEPGGGGTGSAQSITGSMGRIINVESGIVGNRHPIDIGAIDEQPGGEAFSWGVQIHSLIERDMVQSARFLLTRLSEMVLRTPQLQELQRVLAPPTVQRTQMTDPDRSVEYEWLREHGREYRGKWVAVYESHLVGVAESFRALREDLRGRPLPGKPLIHRIP